MLISSVKRWFGKLFQSLTILMKKEYLKELTLASLESLLGVKGQAKGGKQIIPKYIYT